MSFNQTDESLNPTVEVKNPTQILSIRPYGQMTMGVPDAVSKINDQPFGVLDSNWLSISEKEKYKTIVNWPINSTANFPEIVVTWNNIKDLMPVGLDFNTFIKADAVNLHFHPTSTASAQGLAYLSALPASVNFHTNTYYTAISPNTGNVKWQLPKIVLTPSQTQSMLLTFNNPIPFEFIRNGMAGENADDAALTEWLSDYPWGRVVSKVYSPLTTKSVNLLQLQYIVRGSLVNLRTAGLDIHD